MISRISFWAEKGRVTAMLWLDFDFRTGTVNPKFSGLSVYFDGPYGAGFLDAYRFGEDWIDVPVPEFGRYDAKDADEWLRDYVSSVNARLGSGPKPEPSNPPSGDLRPLRLIKAAFLCSSLGHIGFDVATGKVLPGMSEFDGELPEEIDVAEWARRYPGEELKPGDAHDILDFGFWLRAKPGEERRYEPPCEDWRKEREEMIAEEKTAGKTEP